MDHLKPDWITEGWIDFEYQKYRLLAYLKWVRKQFDSGTLYPPLTHLLMHYENLKTLQTSKESLADHFPKHLTGIDLEKARLNYERILQDSELMQEIQELVEYALPQLNRAIGEGRNLYDFVEEHLEMESIGVLPLYKQEGYLLIGSSEHKRVRIFKYAASRIQHHRETFRSLRTEWVGQERLGVSRTLQSIKLELIRTFREWPNPAAFFVQPSLDFPLQGTLLPVSKRLLLQQITEA